MSEMIESPKTRSLIVDDLRNIGLKEGMTVIVHSSLKSIGWVCGGPVAIVQALMEVVTEEGTIIMPAHTADYSDPAGWGNPPVPEEWWDKIREEMPAFDPEITPTFFMGAIVEAFRSFPDVVRSSHPTESFAVWGEGKAEIIARQSLDFSLGENSPLAHIYNKRGFVLLLGVGYDSNTSMHLAEHRIPDAAVAEEGSPVYKNGERVWKTYKKLIYQEELFEEIGAAFEEAYPVNKGKVGSADSKLISQPELVDFTQEWFLNQKVSI